MTYLRVIVKEDVVLSLRHASSTFLSWLCRLVTVRTEEHVKLYYIEVHLTLLYLLIINVDAMFPLYLLNLAFV